MHAIFYISGAIAVVATILMLTRLNAVHALLYLIVSLLAVAVIFYALGAAFAAALEVIIYAGAIMVLFVFAVMTLNLGENAARAEKSLLTPGIWLGPGILIAVLAAEFIYLLTHHTTGNAGSGAVDPRRVGMALFTSYLAGVELASMLLLAGVVGAYHLGWRRPSKKGA